MAGSQFGRQSALQIAKVAQPSQGSADQTGGGSFSPTQIVYPFFFFQIVILYRRILYERPEIL